MQVCDGRVHQALTIQPYGLCTTDGLHGARTKQTKPGQTAAVSPVGLPAMAITGGRCRSEVPAFVRLCVNG